MSLTPPDTHKSIYEDGTYLASNPTWHMEDSVWKAQRILAMMTKNQLTPSSICEIGCGAGEVLSWLHDHLPGHTRFTGYEIAPEAYAECTKRAKDRLEYFLMDPLNGNVPRSDLLLLIDVFEHVEDYMGFLRRLRMIGRHAIFHIPLDLSAQTVFRADPLIEQRRQLGHLHYFTKDTALATLRDTGYEIIDWFYTSGATELPARSLKSGLLRIPRKALFRWRSDLAARLLGRYSIMVLAG